MRSANYCPYDDILKSIARNIWVWFNEYKMPHGSGILKNINLKLQIKKCPAGFEPATQRL